MSGLSRATISRVINGGAASEATRRRVAELLEQTGYRPNIAARTLARGRSGIVGVVMHIDPHLLFHDPYFAELLQGMTDVLADRHAGMTLWLGNRARQRKMSEIPWIGLLEGAIVTAHELNDALVDSLLASSIPTVLLGHRRADRTASYVDIDNVQAADAMTAHLIKVGRRRIGHVTGRRGTIAAEDRIVGYRRAMDRAGLPSEGLMVEGDFERISGATAADTLLERNVDAIFCANDSMAAGALETLHERGCRVPEDVALAGFDDLDFAVELNPPLTTVRQGLREQGQEAAHTLFELLQDPGGGPRRVILPTELVIRQSTVGGA